jgi:hypothetical protein
MQDQSLRSNWKRIEIPNKRWKNPINDAHGIWCFWQSIINYITSWFFNSSFDIEDDIMSEILMQVLVHSPNPKNTYLTPTITKYCTTWNGQPWFKPNWTLCGITLNIEADYATIMFKIQKSKCTFLTKSDVHCKVQNMKKQYNFSRLLKLLQMKDS